MNGQNPLDMLRDIHLPGEVSAWPPAPGWWILAILSIAFILWIVRFFLKNISKKDYYDFQFIP